MAHWHKNTRRIKKRGLATFEIRSKGRKGKSHEVYVGAWRVIFDCGKEVNVPLISSLKIKAFVKKVHFCGRKNCKPKTYVRLGECNPL